MVYEDYPDCTPFHISDSLLEGVSHHAGNPELQPGVTNIV